jgi:hypothetical protein
MVDKMLHLFRANIQAMKEIECTTKVESYEDDFYLQILGNVGGLFGTDQL